MPLLDAKQPIKPYAYNLELSVCPTQLLGYKAKRLRCAAQGGQ